jgi:hypothetical protein
MKASIRAKTQLFGIWCGPAYVVGVIVGWALIAGFIPPHLPSAGAEVIASAIATEYGRIRIGMLVLMFAAMVMIPFTAVVCRFVTQIEEEAGLLTYSILMGGLSTAILTFYPAIWWLVAAFRPDRLADVTLALNDMSWLQLIGGISIFLPLPLGVGLAAFWDDSSDPVFPRWSGYWSIWTVVMILPDQLLFFFHTGPFAWNGLFGFWIPLAVFGSWFLVISYVMRNHWLRQADGKSHVERSLQHSRA